MANPFAHIELSTDDVTAAKAFYKKVFDWKLSTIPGMGYTMIDVGKGTGGGITKKNMKEQPTAWLPYVEVKDVDATLAKAEKAGARIVVPHTDIGDMGVIGVFVDPTGAGIGVWGPQKKAAPKKKAAKKR
jgi:hypothetical protein